LALELFYKQDEIIEQVSDFYSVLKIKKLVYIYRNFLFYLQFLIKLLRPDENLSVIS